ncbi:MAG: 50S ribosomal protein L17, partial [Deltaproteobacteria bacterium]|nr:50S ribosomal protein L17 [Deltaproteobacteria bacterium]
MRHQVDHRKLGRTRPHRRALLRNLASALIVHGRIETTLPKAKELRRVADRLVTLGKRGTIDARRRARTFLMG